MSFVDEFELLKWKKRVVDGEADARSLLDGILLDFCLESGVDDGLNSGEVRALL